MGSIPERDHLFSHDATAKGFGKFVEISICEANAELSASLGNKEQINKKSIKYKIGLLCQVKA